MLPVTSWAVVFQHELGVGRRRESNQVETPQCSTSKICRNKDTSIVLATTVVAMHLAMHLLHLASFWVHVFVDASDGLRHSVSLVCPVCPPFSRMSYMCFDHLNSSDPVISGDVWYFVVPIVGLVCPVAAVYGAVVHAVFSKPKQC